jgi:hypothetical protein
MNDLKKLTIKFVLCTSPQSRIDLKLYQQFSFFIKHLKTLNYHTNLLKVDQYIKNQLFLTEMKIY